jgi:hypothetical protein
VLYPAEAAGDVEYFLTHRVGLAEPELTNKLRKFSGKNHIDASIAHWLNFLIFYFKYV